jgi:CHASE3 domain sensor protein
LNLTFRRYDWRFGLAFFVVLMLLVGNGYLANRSINGLLEAQKWVVHAWQVRTALHDLRANSEASMLQSRSFYMMNDPTFLEGFREAQKKSGDSLTVVEELTKDNAPEKSNTNALRRALKDQLDYANENVEKKRASGKAWSITPELITHFLKRSSAVQSLIGDMDTFEDKLATERLKQASVNEAQARLTILVANIVAVIALMGSLFLIRQYLKARQEV